MTIVAITYTHHSASNDGCCCPPQPQQHGATPDVPIIRGLSADEIWDRLAAMRRQEDDDAYRVSDYLSSSSSDADDDAAVEVDIDGDCRAKMSEWFYQLVDFCQVGRDNVAVAWGFLDRFLSLGRSAGGGGGANASASAVVAARRCLADRREYQLAAMACLMLAVNLHETRQMHPDLLVELSHGKYGRADFVSTAEAVSFGLGWRLNGPTPMAFVGHLLALLPEDDEKDSSTCACCKSSSAAALHRVYELCRVQAELAVSDYRLASSRPSSVAIAVVRNAMEEAMPEKISAFLRSLDGEGSPEAAFDVHPFSAEVERIRSVLKCAFTSSVDGLRQVTSLLRLGEHGEEEVEKEGKGSVAAVRRSSSRMSARCVSQVEHIQQADQQAKKHRRMIGHGDTP